MREAPAHDVSLSGNSREPNGEGTSAAHEVTVTAVIVGTETFMRRNWRLTVTNFSGQRAQGVQRSEGHRMRRRTAGERGEAAVGCEPSVVQFPETHMHTLPSLRTILCAASTLALLAVMAVLAPAPDNKPPTKPANMTVTGKTAWSVSLAWGASSDNSGQLTYKVVCSNGQSVNVPQAKTSVTFTAGLQHKGTFSFWVYAFDAAGNKSKNSNTVSATLPADTIAPSAPVITATNVGPAHIALSWSATDDGSPLIYRLFKDGVLFGQPGSATSTTVYLLEPETTYTFTAQARDSAGNWSPLSAPYAVTTAAQDSSDTTPPSAPSGLWGGPYADGSVEFQLNWTPSTDDVTPQAYIVYDVYINGVWTGVSVGTPHISEYGVFGDNFIELIAVDQAGNESVAASVSFFIP
jgi:chitodextrinase